MRAIPLVPALCFAMLSTFAPPATASLKITRVQVERVEDGRPVLPPDTFTPGEAVHFSFRAEGFTRQENTVKLRFEAQPLDAEGVPLTPAVATQDENTLTPEDKDWQPKLRGSFNLPPVLSGGVFHIRITLEDRLSGATATHEAPFTVNGPELTPSASLSIRALRFYRNDEDDRALDVAAYRIAEEVHARFEIVGFRHDAAGATDVAYGISLTDAAGNVLFAEPVAARDQAQDFYPKPFVPGVVSFHVKPGTPPGPYVLTIDAVDRVGGQKAENRASFRLE